jgi:uncharacterized protein YjdB
MILADNGSSWYLSGAPDERWSNDDLHALTGITGSNFEAVDASALMVDPNSDQARQTSVSVTVSPASASVAVNATRQFSATVNGDSNQQVTWDVNGSIGGNSSVGFIDSISGLYTAPSIAPSPATVTVHATSKSMPSAIGSASVTVTNPTPPVSVTVSPASASVQVGQTRQFTATVQNAANTVTWMVNGIVGGNPAVGSITANGLYIAPSIAPSPAIVTIQAASTVQPSAIGSASVNIASPAPISVTVSPSSASVQVGQTRQFSATVQNAVNSVVWMVNGFIGGNAAVGTITSNGSYTAPLVAPSPATVTVQAASTAVASATGSATVSITTPTPLSVAISPSNASVRLGHTHQFSATVQNAAVTSVMWKVNGIQGGNSTVGTISLTGLYTAPKTMPPSSTVSVSAVSTADPSRSASATVNLTVGPRRPGR